jgi:hypothetical protein
MRAWHIVAFLVCVALSAAIFWQRNELRSFAPRPAAMVSEPTAESPPPETTASEEPARELAALRNEVTQLRARRHELEAAQRENAELLKSTNQTVAAKRPTPAGFVNKDRLANAGYVTPEDALQTLFWSMREGNYAAMMESFAPASPTRRAFEALSPEKRLAMERGFTEERQAVLSTLNDVGIRSREVAADDTMILHVGSSLNTNTVKMRLQRTADGWKFHD